MNKTHFIPTLLLCGLFSFVGCGKSKTEAHPTQPDPPVMQLPKLSEAFVSPSPAQQPMVAEAYRSVRYSQYPQALAALGKLASDPALTESQKKAVNDLIQSIKQAMAQAPAPPSQ
jgi:hypothetical protein